MPHDETTTVDLSRGLRVSMTSIAWTVVASSASIVAGIGAKNLVLVAFGLTGLLDAAGSIALVVHFRHALRHETFSESRERVAFLVVNTGLVVVAVATMIESVHRLAASVSEDGTLLGLGTAATSVVVLTALSRRKLQLGRSIPSHALYSDGMLSATGAVLAVVAVVGTSLSSHGIRWADPVAALVVAAGALGTAVVLARQQPDR
jgi:divalent metal cation (Fe/Co/Zn/Cd) transporter